MNLFVLGAVALLLLVALLLMGESRRETKKLQERAQAQSVRFSDPADEVEPTIITPAKPRESIVRTTITWLGLDKGLLSTRRIPLPVLLPAAILAAGLGSWQASAFVGSAGVVVGIALAALLLRATYNWEVGRNREEVFRQIPDAVGLMVRAVRAGLPVGEAVRSVAREMPDPTRTEFQRVIAEVGIGVPLDRALWSIHERTGLQDYAFLSVVIGLQAQTGGSLAEALENLGNIVRQRVGMAAKAHALSSQARASAIILIALPPVSGTAIALLQPAYLDMLFGDPRGLQMFGVACGMMLMGILVIRGMLRSALRD